MFLFGIIKLNLNCSKFILKQKTSTQPCGSTVIMVHNSIIKMSILTFVMTNINLHTYLPTYMSKGVHFIILYTYVCSRHGPFKEFIRKYLIFIAS